MLVEGRDFFKYFKIDSHPTVLLSEIKTPSALYHYLKKLDEQACSRDRFHVNIASNKTEINMLFFSKAFLEKKLN